MAGSPHVRFRPARDRLRRRPDHGRDRHRRRRRRARARARGRPRRDLRRSTRATAATRSRSAGSSGSSATPASRASDSGSSGPGRRGAWPETAQKTPSGRRSASSSSGRSAASATALEELYLIHFDRIYSYLHMTVGNRHDAEDLTTQTFLRMLESIGKFRFQAAPFSAWLFRIAHNLSMDHFRANRRWQPEEDVPEPRDSEERSAEDEAFQSIGRQSMLDLIDSLSHGAAAGADAEVRLQLLERRGGDDPRQDRGRDQEPPAPRARLAAEADRRHRRS